jgi:hypothetical protein
MSGSLSKKEDTAARRVEKMKAMLSEGKVISYAWQILRPLLVSLHAHRSAIIS